MRSIVRLALHCIGDYCAPPPPPHPLPAPHPPFQVPQVPRQPLARVAPGQFLPRGGAFDTIRLPEAEPSWGLLGGLFGDRGGPLGASWGPLGAESWIFELLVAFLGPSRGCLRALLGGLGRLLGRLGALLGRLGAVLGASWAVLGRSWGPLEPLWSF